MTKQRKKYRGGRPPAIVSEQRKQKAIELIRAGNSQAQVARVLGVTEASVCTSLKQLRSKMSNATERDFETYRAGQLAILESIEDALLENKVAPEVAREWRQIRQDIASLLGLNAASKRVTVNVDAKDGEQLVGYRKFVRETSGLTMEQVEQVYTYARSLARPAYQTILPPERNELSDDET